VSLDHENLIKTKEFFFFDQEKFLVIVMEYCPDGNLDDQIGRIEQPHIEGIMKQIANGLVYLHDNKKIIHRDIKP
jgi:serine/threonine protein kinase